MKRQLKPKVYKGIIAIGIIALYVTAWSAFAGNNIITVIGTAIVFIVGIIGIEEEDKKQYNKVAE